MKLKLVALSLLGVLCLSFSSIGGKDNAPFTLASNKDSLVPKNGFNDLFENAITNNTNGVRLNPRAISFVQDYMEKNTGNLLKMKDWGRPYFNLINTVFAQ